MTNNKLTLPALLVVTVLVAGVFVMGTIFEDAEAAKPDPNPKIKPFKCSSSGTFSGDDGTFSQTGNCSHMGKTTTSGTFEVTGLVNVEGVDCVNIGSIDTVLTAANGDTVEMSITGIQCFFDENGDAVGATGSFCSAGDAHTSTVVGEYEITGGDGRFTGATGDGDISSDANHCNEQPNTDTFESTISGKIKYAASNKS